MNSSNIITLPNPHLRQKSKKVGLITQEIVDLVNGMQQSLLDWESSRTHEVGVALAAVQVDSMLRVVIVRNDFDNKDDHTFSVLINPQITKYMGDVVEDFEGCLSIRDIYGKVPRHTKVKVKGLSLDGSVVRITAEGFLSRVLQHEIDHTEGVVFIDHIKNAQDAFYSIQADGKLEKTNYEKDIKNNQKLWK